MFTGYHDNKLINKVILNKRRWLIMWVWLVIKRACVLVAHGVAHGEQSPASKLNKPHLLLLLLLLLLLMLLLPNHLMNRRVDLSEERPNLLVGTHYRFLSKFAPQTLQNLDGLSPAPPPPSLSPSSHPLMEEEPPLFLPEGISSYAELHEKVKKLFPDFKPDRNLHFLSMLGPGRRSSYPKIWQNT